MIKKIVGMDWRAVQAEVFLRSGGDISLHTWADRYGNHVRSTRSP